MTPQSGARGVVVLDGSAGEGGGQILRTGLALSLLTSRPLEIERIRSGRAKPGLRPQHLQAVEAARVISGAEVEGAAPGSTALRFAPRSVLAGSYRIEIPTAGAATLVLQTVLLPLALAAAREPSRLEIVGGTHVPMAPSADDLALGFLPLLARMGVRARLSQRRAGFTPKGGGELLVEIEPAEAPLRPLALERRGPEEALEGVSLVASLPASIAERQRARADDRLATLLRGGAPRIEIHSAPSSGPGTAIAIAARFAGGGLACASALGAPGKPAERVADEACDRLERFLSTEATLDEFLSDQLLLPCALAAGRSSYRAPWATRHLTTNLATIAAFLGERARLEGDRVEVEGCGLSR